jgi:cell division septum initiation protein DivIVA
LKLVMMEQALTSRIREEQVPIQPTTSSSAPTTTATTSSAKPAVDVKDPKLAAAIKKSTTGQNLTPDEQKMVAGAALMTAESRLRRAYSMLKESEVQQAQVVLAAQDMVDKMQSMLEDTTEMQFKELPALVDSIRNQIGMEQATQFNSDVTAALQGLVQNLQGAKQQLETALGVVTGQPAALDTSMAASGMPGAAPAPMPGAELGADIGADIGAEMDAEEPAPAGAALGRARR